MANQTDVFTFELVGFPGLSPSYEPLVSGALFITYLISFFANSTVIGLIIMENQLHQPMYVIIANLALSDLLFDTITLPKIIAKYWFGARYMYFYDCMFQLYWVHYLGAVDSSIIMMMAIDRYIAICKPLRYSSLMTNKLAIAVCGFLWLIAVLVPGINVIWHSQFPYCRSRKINNCFCVNMAVMVLACGNISLLKETIYWLGNLVLVVPLAFVIFSYITIINKVYTSSGSERLQKAIYTCTTHLFIICMYYGPRVFVYAAYQVNLVFSIDMNVLLLCLYTYIPHMANPIVYCLRTKEIRQILGKIFRLNCSSKIAGN